MSELKACPFCGSKVTLMNLTLPIKMFYCNNYRECGAVVSFNNNKCNLEKGDYYKIQCWNRRDER